MESRESGTIYFIAGLLLGGIVGAGVGLFVAPEAGEKTIARLKKEGGKLVKRSLDAIDDFEKDQVGPAVDKVAKQIKTKVADVRADVKAAI
jgi:gas vesicle protein